MVIVKMSKLKYPPCVSGVLSEKPKRHEFIILHTEGKALTRIKNGLVYYHSVCKHCGLNDPKPPLY